MVLVSSQTIHVIKCCESNSVFQKAQQRKKSRTTEYRISAEKQDTLGHTTSITTIEEKNLKCSTFQKLNTVQRSRHWFWVVSRQRRSLNSVLPVRQEGKAPLATVRKARGAVERSHWKARRPGFLDTWLSIISCLFPQPQNEENTFIAKVLGRLEVGIVQHRTGTQKAVDVMSCNYIKR